MEVPSSLTAALGELGLETSEASTLAEHPGRRVVVRAGGFVVKAFAEAERRAWGREVAGLRLAADAALAPSPPRFGELWSATPWLESVVPMSVSVDERAMHRSLGVALAEVHRLPPDGLPTWPLAERVRQYLRELPSTCPMSLAEDIADVVQPLLAMITPDRFIHGDWGTANVLIRDETSVEVLAVIDFEDSHVGDAAEDFKWQVLAGVTSDQYLAMADGYQRAGGQLGPHAQERLTVAGIELCLDVLGWALPPEDAARFHGRCIQTLEEIAAGNRPDWAGR